MKKFFVIVMVVLLGGVSMGIAKGISNPNMIIEETMPGISSLDPAWIYDTTSAEAIRQMYDSLVQYDATSVQKLVPMLSTNVPTAKDGAIIDNGKTYIFHIRQGVYFHNGDVLTPEDVVYSLERAAIFDRAGGPSWMLAEPLLPTIDGAYVDSIEQWATKLAGVKKFNDLFLDGTRTPKNEKYRQALVDTFNLLAKSFEIKGNDVIIHLPHPYPPILYIVARGSWSSIIDKKWAVAKGAWAGTADTWWLYHNPNREKDPLYSIANGSGPFMLERWSKGREIVFKRFDKYWAGPAKIEYGIIKYVKEFTTRKLDLLRGNADIIYVPLQYLNQVQNISNVKVSTDLPVLGTDVVMFPWNLSSKGNPYIGSGKLDGEGIPPDFFSSKDVRMGFEYLFPYKQYIDQVWNGLALHQNGVIPKPLSGYNPSVPPPFTQDLVKAVEYFKRAYNGELWQKGFKFTAVCDTGNAPRREALDMLSFYARRINSKFRINVVSELLGTYLSDIAARRMPIYTVVWSVDYADPYDFAFPFYASTAIQNYGKNFIEWAQKAMDPLLKASMETTDQQKRAKIYEQMNVIAHNNALYLLLDQPAAIFVRRSWIKGWYYNPIIGGDYRYGVDFYILSK